MSPLALVYNFFWKIANVAFLNPAFLKMLELLFSLADAEGCVIKFEIFSLIRIFQMICERSELRTLLIKALNFHAEH